MMQKEARLLWSREPEQPTTLQEGRTASMQSSSDYQRCFRACLTLDMMQKDTLRAGNRRR